MSDSRVQSHWGPDWQTVLSNKGAWRNAQRVPWKKDTCPLHSRCNSKSYPCNPVPVPLLPNRLLEISSGHLQADKEVAPSELSQYEVNLPHHQFESPLSILAVPTPPGWNQAASDSRRGTEEATWGETAGDEWEARGVARGVEGAKGAEKGIEEGEVAAESRGAAFGGGELYWVGDWEVETKFMWSENTIEIGGFGDWEGQWNAWEASWELGDAVGVGCQEK